MNGSRFSHFLRKLGYREDDLREEQEKVVARRPRKETL
jgi:hypothetical protein